MTYEPTSEDLEWLEEIGGMESYRLLVPACDAARDGNLWRINALLDTGFGGDDPGDTLGPALREAAKKGHLDIVKKLVDAGADVQYGDDDALWHAAIDGRLDVIKFLVSKGADVNGHDGAVLAWACEKNQKDVVEYLLDQGADIAVKDHQAIKYAAWSGQPEILELLLDRSGVDVNIYDTEFLKNAVAGDSADCVRILLERGANVHVEDDAPLRRAAEDGKTDTVRALIEHGADVHVWNDRPILDAATKGHVGVVGALLKAGADVQADNNAPLRKAVFAGNKPLTLLLLKNGADPSANGYTVLKTAENMNGDRSMYFLLQDHIETQKRRALRRDFDIAVRAMGPGYTMSSLRRTLDEDGDTALHFAAKACVFEETLNAALANDPGDRLTADDLLRRDGKGRTVLDHLGETGQLGRVFRVSIWGDDAAGMQRAWQGVAERYRAQVDFETVLGELNVARMRRRRIHPKLKPGGK